MCTYLVCIAGIFLGLHDAAISYSELKLASIQEEGDTPCYLLD